jgi:hypothetical protein
MLLSLMYVKGRGVPSYFPLSAGTARLDARNQFHPIATTKIAIAAMRTAIMVAGRTPGPRDAKSCPMSQGSDMPPILAPMSNAPVT